MGLGIRRGHAEQLLRIPIGVVEVPSLGEGAVEGAPLLAPAAEWQQHGMEIKDSP